MRSRATLPPPPPALPNLTGIDPSDPEAVRSYLASLTTALAQHLAVRPAAGQPQDSRRFTAPNGTVYEMAVDDAGTVQVTALGSTNAGTLPP